ncbi:MAG: heavy metal translocating P-type ATPase [Planctomycetales bacterium]
MFSFFRQPDPPPAGTSICCRAGVVRVDDQTAFGMASDCWRMFALRLREVAGIARVEIDRRRGSAEIHLTAERADPTLLERMAAALSSGVEPRPDPRFAALADQMAARRRIVLFRRGQAWSNWQVVHELPGRIRVRDIYLRGQVEWMRRLELELHGLPGVQTATANPTSGSVLVRYHPQVISRDAVLAALDDAIRQPENPQGLTTIPPGGSFTLANTTLGVATVGEFLFPAVLPVSALLLVGTNLRSFRDAVRELRRGKLGLPVLQTTIVAATLATGGFIAASLMTWLLLFWQNRHARRVATSRQILVSAVRKQGRNAWVVRDGVELETPVGRLQPDDIVALRGGDRVPADGVVLEGSALLDESLVRGVAGLVCRGAGEPILKGTVVVVGELKARVVRCGDATVADRIGAALDAATRHTTLALKHHAPPLAQRAVPASLFTAGLGLAVGDATTAAAVLRPDYATGLGIGGTLLLVHQLGACLEAGIVVFQPRVLADMAAADVLLIDEQPALARRDVELLDVCEHGPLGVDELLQYAERGLRGHSDPRSAALARACLARRLPALNGSVGFRQGTVEWSDRGRQFRLVGLAATEPERNGNGSHWKIHSRLPGQSAPGTLQVWCDGTLAGTLSFGLGLQQRIVQTMARLRSECRLQVELLAADALPGEMSPDNLGFDVRQVCPSDESKAQRIEGWRRGGHRVIYVGNCRDNPQAAQAADVAITMASDGDDQREFADAWILNADLAHLAAFCELARTARRQEQLHYGLTLVPNLACVAGAFLFGFTSLAAVVLSNLGTYSVYRRSLEALQKTERRLLARELPRQSIARLDVPQPESNNQPVEVIP